MGRLTKLTKKYKRIKIALSMTLLLLFLFGQKDSVHAEEISTAITEPTKEEWMEKYPYVYEQEVGQHLYLKGLFDKKNIYFNTGQWTVDEAVLVLKMNASKLLNSEVSYITVYLNSMPIYTSPVLSAMGKEATLVIPLPKERLLIDEINGITIETYLRGQTTDACVDDSATSTWMNIYEDSKIMLGYTPTSEVTDISQFYKKFTSIEALTYKESAIGIGKTATGGILTAMGHVLAGIGQNAVLNYEKIQADLIENEAELKNYPYLIYLETYQNLPISLKKSMSALQKKYAEEGAVVCLLKQDSANILLVTGTNEKALLQAGIMLSNPTYMRSLSATEEAITEKSDFYTEPYVLEEYLNLLSFGVELKGNFEQRASFGVEYPLNRTLTASSQLSLDYRYSDNLDFNRALLTVFIDGIPIGSRKLTKEGANASTENFTIPHDLSVTGDFTVETVFQLYPGDNWCELTPEEIPWAYVADTSMLKLTSIDNTELYFDSYPAPFIKDGVMENVKVLLPKEWTQADLQTMSGILLTLGKYQKSNRGTMEVLTEPTQEQLSNANIISIGIQEKNHMGTENIRIIGQQGAAHISKTVYADVLYAVLTVTGGNEEDMLRTLAYLGKSENIWEIEGDTFTTDGKKIICHYQTKPEKSLISPVYETSAPEEENIPVIIVVSVIVLLLLETIMIIVKYGRKRKDEE